MFAQIRWAVKATREIHRTHRPLESPATSVTLPGVSGGRRLSESLREVEQKTPALFCVNFVPPGGLSARRHVSKLLRARIPALTIVMGHWGLHAKVNNVREALLAAGATHVAATLDQPISSDKHASHSFGWYKTAQTWSGEPFTVKLDGIFQLAHVKSSRKIGDNNAWIRTGWNHSGYLRDRLAGKKSVLTDLRLRGRRATATTATLIPDQLRVMRYAQMPSPSARIV